MQTIQVVLGDKLLKAADQAARKQKVNRSALIRRALQEHLERQRLSELEERDRRGYEARPQRINEFRVWENAAEWPDD
jgi:metal-responsive CopG/Arc/MetJ family transcriptional regulator